MFLRDRYERNLTLKEADNEQSKFFNKLKGMNRGVEPVGKKSFLNNVRLFIGVFEIFEVLEPPFLVEDLRKIICSGVL